MSKPYLIFPLLLFVAAAGALMAQEETPVFRATSDLVLADIQILNVKTGVPATGVRAKDLRIYEDDVPQEIVQFSHDELPLSVVLLFDLTESVRGVLKGLAAGAKDALGHLKPGDEVAVMAYGFTARVVDGFTTDRQRTIDAISKTATIRTNEEAYFNEAMYQAAQQLSTTGGRRRVIIWFTDNYPNVPFRRKAHTEVEALQALHEGGVAVAPILMKSVFGGAIAFGAGVGEKRYAAAYPAGDAKKYAEVTGGEAMNLRGDRADQRLAELIDRLRSRYTAGFRPAGDKPPGTFCRLRVELAPDGALRPKEWKVMARQGYYRK